jgi:putative component of toxin-antitoxin plasmid stabilization module
MRVAKTDAYQAWIDSLKDQVGRARVLMRVDRLSMAIPGFSVILRKVLLN